MRFDLDKYLLLYSDCIPVKGYKQSILCDFTRNKIVSFDTPFFPLFEDLNSRTLKEIYDEFDEESQTNIDQFIAFLLDNNFGQLEDNISNFKRVDTRNWDSYGVIDNAIIDIDEIRHDFASIIAQLNSLGCRYLQLRFYSTIYSLEEILEILKIIEDTSIEGVEIIMKYDDLYAPKQYVSFFESHFLLSALYIYGYSEDKEIKTTFGYKEKAVDQFIQSKIFFISENIDSEKKCGIIDKSYFCVNTINDFIHNINYNSCLNKKVSVDKNGEIKNCPSLMSSYGNISNTKLDQVIHQEFKKIWKISKDEINGCKDCEYRYVCTDCRAYLEKPDDIYSKPLKCGYNPFTNEWTDWEKNAKKDILRRYEIL